MRASVLLLGLFAIVAVLSGAPQSSAQQTASAAPAPSVTTNEITSLTVESSSWRAMKLDVAYQLAGAPSRPTIAARWMRKNGRKLAFTPVSAPIHSGASRVLLSTQHGGMLPPPSEIVVHLELRADGGRSLAQYDCDLTLVNPDGRAAWAADVAKGRTVKWVSRSCARR